MIACFTLFKKEFMRFWKVGLQTLFAPMITALLYLTIFTQVMQDRTVEGFNVPYTTFLLPGLIMMQILQNSFSNPSSSLIQAKVMGSIIFILLPPIGYFEFFIAYASAAIVRGFLIGISVLFVSSFFVDLPLAHPLWAIAFALAGGALFAILGILAGLWSENFDQIATLQNFFILPLTMLSGVFYSNTVLPTFWQKLSYFNPIFYLIDGFRYGFFSQADTSPYLSLMVTLFSILLLSAITIRLIAKGWHLRH